MQSSVCELQRDERETALVLWLDYLLSSADVE